MNNSLKRSALAQNNALLRATMFQKIQQFLRKQYSLAGLPTPLYGFETMAAIYEEHLWNSRETTISYADDTTLAARMREAAVERSTK